MCIDFDEINHFSNDTLTYQSNTLRALLYFQKGNKLLLGIDLEGKNIEFRCEKYKLP